jgi:hypothetical protein
MKASTGAAIAAGVIVAGALTVALFHKTDVAFSLTLVNGVCTPSEPEKLGAGRLRKKVTWAVTNNCPTPQFVSLRNFKERLDNNQLGPSEEIVTPYPVDGGPIPPGQTIEAKVIKFPYFSIASYKYEIWVGDTAANVQPRLDPDIDVWPF